MKRNIILSLLFLFVTNTFAADGHWVGTWATAAMTIDGNNLPPSPGLANNSLRQIIQVSIGGEQVRLKLTNHYGNAAVEIKGVELAVAKTAGSSPDIDEKSSVSLTFGGKKTATIAKGSMLVSDAVNFPMTPRQNVAITIHYGASPSSNISGHSGSRTTSYLAKGNTSDFASAAKTDHWYNILALETMADDDAGCVAVMGNSITDGRGSTTNQQNRWTDMFSRALLANEATSRLGVLNFGIGGNCVLFGGLGPTASSRCQRDLFEQEGVKYIILFEGVNDLGGSSNGVQTARSIIEVWKQVIRQAHQKGIRVIGATVTPFKNNSYYSADHEAGRQKLNNWIMTTKMLDGAIDFASMVCDPNNSEQLNRAYLFENDYLHPNAAGYKLMGESIDLSLFSQTGPLADDDEPDPDEVQGQWFEAESLRSGDYGKNFRVGEDQMASGGKYLETANNAPNESSNKADQLLLTFTVDQDDTYYIYARLLCPTWDDDSYFVAMDNGASEMVNGLQASSWTWKQIYRGQLKAGEHQLRITGREDGARLDKLCVTTSPTEPLSIGGTTAVAAVMATLQHEGATYYALDGHQLSAPKQGLCIVREGGTSAVRYITKK